jgi:DNA-binding NarL/FixJ family response regulator
VTSPPVADRGAAAQWFVAVSPSHRPVRVVIVADVRLFRDGLAELIGQHAGVEVVAGTRSADVLGLDLDTLAPDVVLWDVATQGVDVVREFIAAFPGLRVLVLSIPELEPEIIRFAEAGMAGYVTRDADVVELVAAVRSAVRGEALCSPRVAATLLRRVAALAHDDLRPSLARLTPREVEILELIRRGMTNKEIGAALTVELSTVKNHVHNILEKLGARRRSEAASRLALVGSTTTQDGEDHGLRHPGPVPWRPMAR